MKRSRPEKRARTLNAQESDGVELRPFCLCARLLADGCPFEVDG